MAGLADLAAPEMRTATGFHGDDAPRTLTEERQHPVPPQRLAQHRPARRVNRLSLKHVLRRIEPDRDHLRHDRSPLGIFAGPRRHTDAVGGAVTPSRPVVVAKFTRH
jgi:hypothetical protein